MTSKIVSRPALAKILKHRGGKKVVFTNGCFDILHVGHVRLFKKARRLGDILVVAVNSDRSLKKLKGPKRPLVGEKKRAEILSALDCVDYVTVFGEDTPKETILVLKPDILVKGADYNLHKIVGHDQVRKVVRFPLVKGISTTDLIRKIVRAYGCCPLSHLKESPFLTELRRRNAASFRSDKKAASLMLGHGRKKNLR